MNPFEIRYALLTTAKDFLTQQYEAQIKALELADGAAKKAELTAPKFPTMAEIINQAIEMNKFISGAVDKELVGTARKFHGITAIF